MIATIKGFLSYKSVSDVIVDVNGIGYHVFIPLSTFYELPETGQPVFLNIHTHVKEDALHLFGFRTSEEKDIFQLMISVSGIGPRLALNVLSGISARELADAVSSGNFTKLMGIPGIGKKTAERLVFELKDKIAGLWHTSAGGHESDVSAYDRLRDDAMSALVNLGYKSHVASQVLDKSMKEQAEGLTLEELLKEALKQLGK
ncbi:MAG: Holliday junction branch migration protein RuvA [Syntrophales bacterium]